MSKRFSDESHTLVQEGSHFVPVEDVVLKDGETIEDFVDPPKRPQAYGSVNDQLDMMYWDQVNGTTLWKDHIAKVKKDIPK